MSRTLLASASVLALSSLAWPGIAGAQQKEETTVLEPITVTATKRVQEAFEVPATVAIVEAQELQDRGIASAGELDRAFVDTNIRSRSNRAYTNVTVRGQSSVDYYEPSVQLYVDGLPQDPSIFSQLLPAGLDSVELLYGPQGTLYGRGAIGGVINVVTRKPDNELRVDTAGALHTQGGDASLLLNTPIIDGVIYGDAALTFRREADQYTLLGSGQEIGGTDDLNGRIRLRYAPDDSPLDVMVSTQRGRVDSTEEQFVMESMFNDRIALPIDSRYRLDTASFGVNASYDLDFATITALTGYQDRKLDRTTLGFQTPEDQTTFSQELRIASDPELGNALDYVVGVYGQRLDFERRTPLICQVSQQTIDSYAIFGDLAWHATDRLDISPGLRFDYEKARARADGAVTIAGERSFGGVSPKLGASYALDDEWRVHGLFSTGYKAGGFTRNVTPENIAFTYDPQNTDNGETGIKYRALDGSLEASLSAYYNVTKDYQLFVGDVYLKYLQNAGEVTAKGINLAFRANPTERLGIAGGLGLNRTTFTKYENSVNPGIDYTGNRVPYAPEFTANLALDYAFDLAEGWGQLIPRAGMTYAGSVFFDETNTIGQKGFFLVDLGLSWKVSEQVVADVFVNNVFDETYAVYGFTEATYGNLYQLGTGRAFGGRVSFKF
ncbi:TonB-dependent receptor [Sinorhizobium meliloti]|uniref:TonB-dependent receptor n=1 Tax=Rhizobium meliloti TaxID=382 RepID=UPI000FD3E7D5|nr:TonB-dependent receptor [Sinorhizobium meliloti]RVH10193.1 TonB-dependent receptor [Sinorhizobium meliloti]